MSVRQEFAQDCLQNGPQSALERTLIQDYLMEKGYRLADLRRLPPEERRRLMKDACQYASLKLATIESTSHMHDTLHLPQ
ncbi:MAG: hypothetical protein R3272_14950 [Candidatus Promineifilaceae bacterium]|nr:hypothetical protein [Candidatus Promineifilaceae bacterium]